MASACLNPTLNTLLTKMRDGGIEQVPAGWRTVAELATEWQITQPTARYHVTRLVAAGMMEMREFRIGSGNLAVQSIRHYRLAE